MRTGRVHYGAGGLSPELQALATLYCPSPPINRRLGSLLEVARRRRNRHHRLHHRSASLCHDYLAQAAVVALGGDGGNLSLEMRGDLLFLGTWRILIPYPLHLHETRNTSPAHTLPPCSPYVLTTPQVRTNVELADTTKDLRDEKARMDALLVRQYNLIQCFSNPKATTNDLAKAGTATGDSNTVGEKKGEGGGYLWISITVRGGGGYLV